MSGIKVGDKVRCTLGDSVLVGTATEVSSGAVIFTVSGSRVGEVRTVFFDQWFVEVIAPPPPEPPAGSVVRWGIGTTFLNLGNGQGWINAVEGGVGYRWEYVAGQPFTLLIPATQVIEDVRGMCHSSPQGQAIAEALAAKYGVEA